MRRRGLVMSTAVAVLLLLAVPATAVQPTRIAFTVDETFPSPFLTALCGVPVSLHVVAAGTTTLFYDRTGTQVIRELDTLAEGARTTFFSPLEAGGTGKSFTDVTHSPATFSYPEGTELGDPAIVTLNGVQRTTGPGGPRIVGHQVSESVIIGFTSDGVPIAEPVATISQSGQFDVDAVLQARCASLTDP